MSWKETCFFKIRFILIYGLDIIILFIDDYKHYKLTSFSHFSTITHLQLLSSLQLSGNARRGN